MEAGRPGAAFDYFDDDHLYNGVTGRCVTPTLQTELDLLSLGREEPVMLLLCADSDTI